MLMPVLLFLAVFTLIALAHEGGHFIAAKLAGMSVLEFGIGFGPRLWSKEFRGTVYSVNLIPILAFVSIAGMDDSRDKTEAIPEEQMYFSKPPLTRFWMAFMGPFSNVLLAFVILSSIFMFAGVPNKISNFIDQVQPGSVAEKAGLTHGDELLSLNGKKVEKMEDAIAVIHKSDGKILTLRLRRGDEVLTVKAAPEYNPRLKVAVLGFTPLPEYQKVSPWEALGYGLQQTFAMIVLLLMILWQLMTGTISVGELAGPVGIAQITGRYASTGLLGFLNFVAFLNVNIGVLNLLPLPALDGGHIVFAIVEMITRRPVSEGVQKRVHQWGLIALLVLMALVTANDLLRLFRPR